MREDNTKPIYLHHLRASSILPRLLVTAVNIHRLLTLGQKVASIYISLVCLRSALNFIEVGCHTHFIKDALLRLKSIGILFPAVLRLTSNLEPFHVKYSRAGEVDNKLDDL